jgi:hypothetical protein
MPDPAIPGPDVIPATDDPGDDTASRYRYQWMYAAIICCMLLDDTEDVAEVFCEHHEDVLIKHTDATFTGIQVKTRSSDQKVWKTGDPAFQSLCARFAKLEHDFPGRFRAFQFLTNHPLFSEGNGQDLCHVLATIQAAVAMTGLPISISRFLSKIAKKAGCSDDVAFVALSKTHASDDLPKRPDIAGRLVTTLNSTWKTAEEPTLVSVQRAARFLADECGRASSLAHEDTLPAYLPLVSNPAETELATRLDGKRFDKTRILDILNQGLNETALLESNPESWSRPGTGSSGLLMKKLDAGGLSAITCNSAKDLRDKADYLSIVWTKKHGRTSGLKRYDHIRSLVLSDSARAFEAAQSEERPFGRQMLSELRARFNQRRQDGRSQLFDCSNEHLEGFAYILTSECEVDWSLDRPWEAQ